MGFLISLLKPLALKLVGWAAVAGGILVAYWRIRAGGKKAARDEQRDANAASLERQREAAAKGPHTEKAALDRLDKGTF